MLEVGQALFELVGEFARRASFGQLHDVFDARGKFTAQNALIRAANIISNVVGANVRAAPTKNVDAFLELALTKRDSVHLKANAKIQQQGEQGNFKFNVVAAAAPAWLAILRTHLLRGLCLS